MKLAPISPQSPYLALLFAACTVLSACGGGDGTPTAANQAANVSSAVHAESLTSRNVAPTVSIASPSDGALTSSSSVAVSGLASDDQGVRAVTFTINGVTAYATLDAPNSHYTNYTFTLPLAVGPNTVTIKATDLYGMSGSTTLSVTRTSGTTQPPPPQSGLIADTRLVPIPDVGGYPDKGVAVTDPITGMKVVRAADKSELTGDYGGYQSAQSIIVYSRYTPANTTGEYFLVHGDNSTSAWLYRTSDNKMMTVLRFAPSQGTASRALGELNELRWDYSGAHPYRLYFVGRSIGGTGPAGENVGMSFYYTDFDPATGKQSNPVLIHDFSLEFPGLAGAEIMNDVEGDSSNNSRYWAWQVMNTSLGTGYLPYAVFSYDMQANAVLGSIRRSCAGSAVPCVAVNTLATAAPYLSRPNMVEMSPLGTRVVVDWGRAYTGNRDADKGGIADGPKGFLRNFSDPIRIGADETHSGWAWGPNGEEMFVSQNDRNDYVEAVDIKNATTANCTVIADNSYTCGVKIVPYPVLDGGTWTLGMHFGKVYDPNKKGWVFMNTYDKSYATWGKNQNLLVQINDYTKTPSHIFRFGSSYNLYQDYRSEGSGALDFRGENIWATANWGYTDGRGDAFRVTLPANWFGMLY